MYGKVSTIRLGLNTVRYADYKGFELLILSPDAHMVVFHQTNRADPKCRGGNIVILYHNAADTRTPKLFAQYHKHKQTHTDTVAGMHTRTPATFSFID